MRHGKLSHCGNSIEQRRSELIFQGVHVELAPISVALPLLALDAVCMWSEPAQALCSKSLLPVVVSLCSTPQMFRLAELPPVAGGPLGGWGCEVARGQARLLFRVLLG